MKVCNEQCNQCLFSENRIVSAKAKKAILKECLEKDTFFVCHKATIANGQEICCRGFYDGFGATSGHVRFAQRINFLRFVDPEHPDKILNQ